MGNVGVIAEYNPFHNGHAYHLAKAKAESGGGRVIVVMSGDFVQRGEPAAFNKFIRTKWALENGADMVLLLPSVFSLSGAEGFALGGVGVLAGTGLVNSVAFGSECGCVEKLRVAASLLDNEPDDVGDAVRRGLSQGLSYPLAQSRAHAELGSEAAGVLYAPNDILGIEYIRALNVIAPEIAPLPIRRVGAAHDSASTQDGFLSASAIRRNIDGYIAPYVPKDVHNDICTMLSEGCAPRRIEALSQAVLYALRRMQAPDIARIPDVSEGLENAIVRASHESATLDDFFMSVKTRRYTMARLKRIVMCALLGISCDAKSMLPGLYIRVLGVRKDAKGLLNELAQAATLPVITRFSDTAALNSKQLALHDIDMLASRIAPLAAPCSNAAGARFDYASPLITLWHYANL